MPVEFTVCPLCVPPFPPVYGTLLLTLAAGTAKVKVPLFVELAQVKAVMVPTGKATILARVQVFPPMLKAKLAVPLLDGVPVIVYVKLPAPVTKLPDVNVAVSPVTPVEVIVCPLCKPPFPPVYAILLLTLAAAIPCVNVPVLVAVEQASAVILPGQIPPVVQMATPPQLVNT